MPLVKAQCTNCDGILEVDPSKDAAICPHCGTPYIVEKAINHYNTTNTVNNTYYADTINVTNIQETEYDLLLRKWHGHKDRAVLSKMVAEYPDKYQTYEEQALCILEDALVGQRYDFGKNNLEKFPLTSSALEESFAQFSELMKKTESMADSAGLARIEQEKKEYTDRFEAELGKRRIREQHHREVLRRYASDLPQLEGMRIIIRGVKHNELVCDFVLVEGNLYLCGGVEKIDDIPEAFTSIVHITEANDNEIVLDVKFLNAGLNCCDRVAENQSKKPSPGNKWVLKYDEYSEDSIIVELPKDWNPFSKGYQVAESIMIPGMYVGRSLGQLSLVEEYVQEKVDLPKAHFTGYKVRFSTYEKFIRFIEGRCMECGGSIRYGFMGTDTFCCNCGLKERKAVNQEQRYIEKLIKEANKKKK